MSNIKTVSWGIIGCGNVTEVKSGPAFNKVSGSRLVAVMRRDAVKAEDYARRHGVPKWYFDAAALINDPEVNSIYIATPPAFHAEYTLMSALAGKHVYVEKPMALSAEACQIMINECRTAGIKLFVAYYRRRLPYFLKIKELIESGAIGRPLNINIRLHKPPRKEDLNEKNLPWRVIPEIGGAGYFYDLASHQLDILKYIFGGIAEASGCAGNRLDLYPAVDYVEAAFEFCSGVSGTGSWCFTVPADCEDDSIYIVGTEGRLTASTYDRKTITVTNASGRQKYDPEWPTHIQQPLIQSVVDDILGRDSCPSTGDTAIATNVVMEKILGGRM